ncbi:MAG TPA: dTMP kinase [Micromonosporaceae bacterium]|nr:dTMP kinase [Micromonosporaceae bacterium]
MSGRGAAAGPPRSPRVIALVGIDGSGKTTQAHRLAATLTTQGTPATYWQNAGGRRWFGRLARGLGLPDARRLLGREGLLAVESALRWLAILRALVRSRLTGRIAVMDRYAACQFASIRVQRGGRLSDRLARGERLARLAYAAFPRPQVTFLLAVDPTEAYRRIERRGTDHESLEFLARSAEAYRRLPEVAQFVVVDAGGTVDEVAEAIRGGVAAPCLRPGHRPGSRRR